MRALELGGQLADLLLDAFQDLDIAAGPGPDIVERAVEALLELVEARANGEQGIVRTVCRKRLLDAVGDGGKARIEP